MLMRSGAKGEGMAKRQACSERQVNGGSSSFARRPNGVIISCRHACPGLWLLLTPPSLTHHASLCCTRSYLSLTTTWNPLSVFACGCLCPCPGLTYHVLFLCPQSQISLSPGQRRGLMCRTERHETSGKQYLLVRTWSPLFLFRRTHVLRRW